MEEDTIIHLDKMQAEAPPSPYPALSMQVEEHFATLIISFGPGTWMAQAVTAEQMNQLCHQWLSRHKNLGTH